MPDSGEPSSIDARVGRLEVRVARNEEWRASQEQLKHEERIRALESGLVSVTVKLAFYSVAGSAIATLAMQLLGKKLAG